MPRARATPAGWNRKDEGHPDTDGLVHGFRAFFVLIALSALVLSGCEPPRRIDSKNAPYTIDLLNPAAVPGAPQPVTPVLVESGSTGQVRSDQIFGGSGVFIGSKPPTGPAPVDSTGDVTLGFVNTDIREVVRLVLGNTLGLNYVVDPEVQGTVTLNTGRPMNRDDLLNMLQVVLRQNGASLVETDGLYRVVPTNRALPARLEIGRAARSAEAGYRITVVPLRFIAAEEMRRILDPLAPDDNILYVDNTRNLLILGGYDDEIAAMADAIDSFDIDWLSGMSFGLFHLNYVSAETMAKELSTVLFDEEGESLANLLRLVPIERMNAVIAISPQRRYVDVAGAWIDRLDVAGSAVDRQVFLYSVQNGRATELAEVLNALLQEEASTAAAAPRDPVLAPNLTPAVVSRPLAEAEGVAAGGEPAASVESPTQPAAKAAAPVAEVAATLGSAPAAREGSVSLGAAPVRVVADDKRNALLISGTTRDYRSLLSLLRTLDAEPLQVLIEATIAEVSLRDELRYGLQWFFQSGDHATALTRGGSSNVAPAFPGFAYTFLTQRVRFVLDALSDLTDVEVISSPQLMVLNNETASMQIGDQVPVPVASAVNTNDPDAAVVNTISFRDTGVVLRVRPRVNASGMVTLEVEQEVSEAVRTVSSGIDAPTIQQRKVSSVVAVPSGATIALAGLIRDSKSRTDTGLPVLHKAPVVGPLFGSTSDVESRTELLILITPRVVRNHTELLQVTEELRRKIRRVEPLYARVH